MTLSDDKVLGRILADINNKTLYVEKDILEYLGDMSHGFTSLYFTYKNRYPDFKDVIF